MLTRRIVIFKGREGWFSTREFVGDRQELEAIHSQDTCEATWKSISRAFQGVKTLQEFQTTASWAEHLYHSAVESPQEDPPSLPDDMPLLAARGLEKRPGRNPGRLSGPGCYRYSVLLPLPKLRQSLPHYLRRGWEGQLFDCPVFVLWDTSGLVRAHAE